MQVHVHVRDGRTIVKPLGRIDGDTAPALRDALIAAIDTHPHPVALELDEVPYVGSAALRVMALAIPKLKARGQRLKLVNVSVSVYSVLEIAGFTSLVEVEM